MGERPGPVLVTGANTGFGLAAVLRFAGRGWPTWGTVRSKAKAKVLADAAKAAGVADLVHPLTGPQRVVGPIIKMSATATAARIAAPPLGADTRAILADAGFAESEIAALISTHAISTRD